MWNEITTEQDLLEFLEKHGYFHDSCIKEIKYYSGAYVKEDLCMWPFNNDSSLKMIVQRQHEDNSVIEFMFNKLKFLKVFPCDDKYTCEILDISMFFDDNLIYFCDCGGHTKEKIKNYEGTVICAESFCWRVCENCLGSKEVYVNNDEL